MFADFNYDQLQFNNSSDLWNVKCENARHFQNNITIASYRWVSRNLTANIYLLLAI